jgi:hypothetical protein
LNAAIVVVAEENTRLQSKLGWTPCYTSTLFMTKRLNENEFGENILFCL